MNTCQLIGNNFSLHRQNKGLMHEEARATDHEPLTQSRETPNLSSDLGVMSAASRVRIPLVHEELSQCSALASFLFQLHRHKTKSQFRFICSSSISITGSCTFTAVSFTTNLAVLNFLLSAGSASDRVFYSITLTRSSSFGTKPAQCWNGKQHSRSCRRCLVPARPVETRDL